MTNIRVEAIAPDVVSELREKDDVGRAPHTVVETEQRGDPLRCCLRRSRPGERKALVSYAPLRRWARERDLQPGAYDEVGPVFIHAEPCSGPDFTRWPEEIRGDRRVLRAYSADGRILSGHLFDAQASPTPIDETASDLLADSEVAVLHVRAVEFGCFHFLVHRG